MANKKFTSEPVSETSQKPANTQAPTIEERPEIDAEALQDFQIVHLPEAFGQKDKSARDWVYTIALDNLKRAYERGVKYVIFTHESFRPGRTTACSHVRKLMRSKDATPYIIRSKCIQHISVFVAAIRPKKD